MEGQQTAPQQGQPQTTAQLGVYHVEAEISVNFSIQSPNGDWIKKGAALTAKIGPGYPPTEYLAAVMHQMNHDCEAICEEEIDSIAQKIADKAMLAQQQAAARR